MNPYRFLHQLPDPDAGEVQEWADSLDALTEVRGAAHARRVLLHLLGRAHDLGRPSHGRRHVVVAALHALAQRGDIRAEVVTDAICRYGIDPDASDPRDA